MCAAAKGAMQDWVWRRGCRSQRQEREEALFSSSRPKTVVRMPAMWKVLLETCSGWGKDWAVEPEGFEESKEKVRWTGLGVWGLDMVDGGTRPVEEG